jgi:hypothetical protein
LEDRGNDAEATPVGVQETLVKVKGTPDKGQPRKRGFTIAVVR